MTFLETHTYFGSSWEADLRYSSFENVYIYHVDQFSFHEKRRSIAAIYTYSRLIQSPNDLPIKLSRSHDFSPLCHSLNPRRARRGRPVKAVSISFECIHRSLEGRFHGPDDRAVTLRAVKQRRLEVHLMPIYRHLLKRGEQYSAKQSILTIIFGIW